MPIEKIGLLVGYSDAPITETVYRHQLKPEIREGAEHMNILREQDIKSA